MLLGFPMDIYEFLLLYKLDLINSIGGLISQLILAINKRRTQ